jgi:hypothetical protein
VLNRGDSFYPQTVVVFVSPNSTAKGIQMKAYVIKKGKKYLSHTKNGYTKDFPVIFGLIHEAIEEMSVSDNEKIVKIDFHFTEMGEIKCLNTINRQNKRI